MKDLIDLGRLAPGKGVLVWNYKAIKTAADLMKDGSIKIEVKGERHLFKTPTAFAKWMGKQAGSSRKGCNGWEEVFFRDKALLKVRDVTDLGDAPEAKSKVNVPISAPPKELSLIPTTCPTSVPAVAKETNTSVSPTIARPQVMKVPAVAALAAVSSLESGFLARYRVNGDNQTLSKADKVRVEALKKHSGITSAPLASVKATGLRQSVLVSNQAALKKTKHAQKLSDEATMLLKNIEELTKICDLIEKEQALLAQVDSGTLILKDDGLRMRENAKRLAEEFNEKAARACSPLLDDSCSKALTEEVQVVRPDFNRTLSSLIHRVNAGAVESREPKVEDKTRKNRDASELKDKRVRLFARLRLQKDAFLVDACARSSRELKAGPASQDTADGAQAPDRLLQSSRSLGSIVL